MTEQITGIIFTDYEKSIFPRGEKKRFLRILGKAERMRAECDHLRILLEKIRTTIPLYKSGEREGV